MKIFKLHKNYNNNINENIRIINIFDFKIVIYEFYNPHWLEIIYLSKNKHIGSYNVKTLKKLPLCKKAHQLDRTNKLNSSKIRLDVHIRKIMEEKCKC